MRKFLSRALPSRPVVAVALTLFAFTAGFAASSEAAGWVRPGEPTVTGMPHTWESRFLLSTWEQGLFLHHVTELCDTRSQHPELTQLCSTLRLGLNTQLPTLENWLSDWYGVDVDMSNSLSPRYQRLYDRLQGLNGQEFEREFLRLLLREYRSALRLADRCGAQATHSELGTWCEQWTMDRDQALRQFQEWLCTWYQDCGGKSGN